MMREENGTQKHNRSVDGLRGLAALGVVFHHFTCAFLPALLSKNFPESFSAPTQPSLLFSALQFPLLSLVYNGHFAVLLFFALSGYVLVMPYFSGERAKLKQRLLGRYVRLNIPVAAAVPLSFAFYILHFYAPADAAADLSGSIGWLKKNVPQGMDTVSAVKAALFGAILSGDGRLDPPLWTIKIELLGSFWLLGFYLLKPKHWQAVSYAVLTLLIYKFYGSKLIFYAAIFIGATFNQLKLRARACLALALIGLYFGAFQYDSMFYDFLPRGQLAWLKQPDVKTFYNTLGALALTAAVVNGWGRRLLTLRPVQYLGRISFSLYLLHFLLLCSLASALYVYLPQTPVYLALNFAIYLAASFALASIFTQLIDRTAIRLSHRFARSMGDALFPLMT